MAPGDRYRGLRGHERPLRLSFGDFSVVNRPALIQAKQRAAQNDHPEVEKAADQLLSELDDAAGE